MNNQETNSIILPSISIVVPVFNEEENIVGNIALLKLELSKHFGNYEIFLISDGSTDKTSDIIATLENDHTKIICFKDNRGKGAAIRAGFEQCSGDYILFIDGGMELHPKEIRIFMGLMSLYSADMVIGSKRHPQSVVFYPWYRRFLSMIYQKLIRCLFSFNITDTQVGIKLFRGKLVREVLPYLKINHYGFDLEIISLAVALGYDNILEAPIRLDYFLKNRRSVFLDLIHTIRVGNLLFIETIMLYITVRKLKIIRKKKISTEYK